MFKWRLQGWGCSLGQREGEVTVLAQIGGRGAAAWTEVLEGLLFNLKSGGQIEHLHCGQSRGWGWCQERSSTGWGSMGGFGQACGLGLPSTEGEELYPSLGTGALQDGQETPGGVCCPLEVNGRVCSPVSWGGGLQPGPEASGFL